MSSLDWMVLLFFLFCLVALLMGLYRPGFVGFPSRKSSSAVFATGMCVAALLFWHFLVPDIVQRVLYFTLGPAAQGQVSGKKETKAEKQMPQMGPADPPREPGVTSKTVSQQIVFTRKNLMEMMQSVHIIRKQIKVLPYLVQNQHQGYRITWIEKGSVLGTKFGIEAGDILLAVNGKKASGREVLGDLSEIFNGEKERIQLTFLRKGSERIHEFVLKN